MPKTDEMASINEARDAALAPVLRAARRHWLLIAACVLLGGGSAGVYASTRAAVYKATTQVLVTPLSSASSYGGLPVLTNSVDPTRTIQTAASILESPSVADRVVAEFEVRSRAGGRPDPSSAVPPLEGLARRLRPLRPAPPQALEPSLARMTAQAVTAAVSVDPLGDSDIVSVVARRRDPTAAQQLANAYARNALEVRSETLRAVVLRSVDELRARQSAADVSSPSAVELARELSDLQRILDGQDPNFSLLKVAGPADRTGASAIVLGVLGAMGGMLLGLVGAVGLDQVNRRISDEEELLAVYPLPVLARVPALPRAAETVTGLTDLPPAFREAMRVLQFQLEDGRPAAHRAVMLTSPSSGDGKSTTALLFALAAAASGAEVIVLDLDLRKSDLGGRLGLQIEMMDLASSSFRLEDHLREVPDVPRMRILSFRVHDGVSPLFESVMRRVASFVSEARTIADLVVIDTPPLGILADALRIAGAVDDIVLIARPGHTDRKQLQRTGEVLDRLGHTPTGVVLVGQGRASDEAYGYGPQAAAPASETVVTSGTGERRR